MIASLREESYGLVVDADEPGLFFVGKSGCLFGSPIVAMVPHSDVKDILLDNNQLVFCYASVRHVIGTVPPELTQQAQHWIQKAKVLICS